MIVGVGIDIVDIDRMRLALVRTPSVINKILTTREITELGEEKTDEKQFIASVAARFAAKEATVKSLGLSLFAVGLHSIEITKNALGVPAIEFPQYQSFLSDGANEKTDVSFFCSLTHSTLSAGAVVIAQSSSVRP